MSIDWNKPLRMIDGRSVRCVCQDRNFLAESRLTKVILIADEEHGELLASCDDQGRIFAYGPLADAMAVENWEGVQ